MSAILEVDDLTVDIPLPGGVLHAVQGVSFSLSKGETLCLVGESGCGKSLTSLAVMDLLPRNALRRAKRLVLSGEDLLTKSERQMNDIRGDRMSMIFQEPMTSLNPAYTIGNQLEEVFRRHRRVARREATDRAVYLLERVGITAAASRLGQYPHQLSGGLRQRVMIAMALMCEPDLVIADEPTTALDVTIQAQILLLLAELQAEFQMALVLITHDLGVVSRVADKVAVMYAGQIVEQAGKREIFESPLHPYTQGLLGCILIPGKKPRGSQLGVIPGMVPSLVGDMLGCRFRDRCDHATAVCADADVPLRPASEGRRHSYRCVLDRAALTALSG